MSGAPAAAHWNSISLCAVRCAPDRHCRLSGVHRTGTVDCPVHPYRVLKKLPPARDWARGSLLPLGSLLSGSLISLAIYSPSSATSPHRRPPCSGDTVLLSCPRSVSIPFSLCLSSLSVSLSSKPLFHSLCQTQFPIQFCESMWWEMLLCVPWWFRQVSSSLGRVSQPKLTKSPKT
jgi:hypothetical protein